LKPLVKAISEKVEAHEERINTLELETFGGCNSTKWGCCPDGVTPAKAPGVVPECPPCQYHPCTQNNLCKENKLFWGEHTCYCPDGFAMINDYGDCAPVNNSSLFDKCSGCSEHKNQQCTRVFTGKFEYRCTCQQGYMPSGDGCVPGWGRCRTCGRRGCYIDISKRKNSYCFGDPPGRCYPDTPYLCCPDNTTPKDPQCPVCANLPCGQHKNALCKSSNDTEDEDYICYCPNGFALDENNDCVQMESNICDAGSADPIDCSSSLNRMCLKGKPGVSYESKCVCQQGYVYGKDGCVKGASGEGPCGDYGCANGGTCYNSAFKRDLAMCNPPL